MLRVLEFSGRKSRVEIEQSSSKIGNMKKTVLPDPNFEWARHPIWSNALFGLGKHPGFNLLNTCVAGTEAIAGNGASGSAQSQPVVVRAQDPALSPEILSSAEFKILKEISIQLFRRENRFGMQREIDCEVEFYRRLTNWRKFLLVSRPDLVLFPVTPHFVSSFTLMVAAKTLGISTLWFQPSSLAPMMLPRTSISQKVSLAASGHRPEAEWNRVRNILSKSLDQIDGLRIKPYLQSQRTASRNAKTVKGRVLALRKSFLWLFKDRFEGESGLSRSFDLPRIVERLLQILVPRAILQSLTSEVSRLSHKGPLPQCHATFALHYEPERTSVPESSLVGSQLEQIMLAKDFVSDEMELVVREHESQLSPALQGYLGRAPKLYSFLVNDLKIKLDRSAQLHSIFESSSIIFTGTGNIGIESALRGVPVVYFGEPWWQGMPGTYRYSEVCDSIYSPSLLSTGEPEQVKDFLRKRVLEEMLPGGASESIDELENRFGSLGPQFIPFAAEATQEFLVKWIQENC